MQLIFSTGSLWSYSLARCFAFAAAAGFDGLELMADQRWETRQVDFLRQLIDRHGLPILAVHSPFMGYVPGWPSDQPTRIKQSVALAEAVGAGVVVHHLPNRIGYVWVQIPGRIFPLPVPWNPENGYRKWLDEEYAALQASTEVKLCIENMPAYHRFGRRWNFSHWNTPRQIARFPNLTLDTTHLGTWGQDPAAVYGQLADRVSHIHLSNYENGKEHRRPEKGELALDDFLAQVAAAGYQGTVCLELSPDALDEGLPDEEIIARMATSLAYCRQAVAQA